VSAGRSILTRLYDLLLAAYGRQGWWPSAWSAGRRGFDPRGYHPGRFDFPGTAAQRFEIAIGAVLTQNTAWTNVEKALEKLFEAGITSPRSVLATPVRRLAVLITPSGYYNQKAKKLGALAELFLEAKKAGRPPTRDELLSVWGVGEETADSILLYAYARPAFVVDAYTRRLLERLGLLRGGESYPEIQEIFHAALPAQPELFNEYHALIVEHAKRRCRTKPLCAGCPVTVCPLRRRPGEEE
jgi:endonuclease-3 related protein